MSHDLRILQQYFPAAFKRTKPQNRRKSLQGFISEHRQELTEMINGAMRRDLNERMNDKERRLWILNDEGLYRWARSEGVKI